jgi:hypothetical protein
MRRWGPHLRRRVRAFRAPLQATPDRPVRLEVFGLLRLRIEVWPLHLVGLASAVDDWLRVAADD